LSRLRLFPEVARPLVFAHRGISSLAPENTMAAFKLSRELGIPGVELDVHLTSDGKLAVFHDHSTARIAGTSLELERSTWRDLSALDVGAWKGAKYKGERMMQLCELFEEFGDSLYYDVELKSNIAADYGLEAAVATCFRDAFSSKAGLTARILVSSFNPMAVARFKYLSPAIPTAIIWSGEPDVPAYLRHGEGRWIGKVDALKPDRAKVTGLSAFRWRKVGGYPVVPWTVDSPAESARLLALGCDGIISNKPQELGLTPA
jgi:glycerophosphoryl diester phosphodiesterase